MTHDQWHWQEPGTAWKGVGIYHVTLTIPSREPLLGTLVIPNNDPKQASVERTELGETIVHTIFHIQDVHPEVRVLQFCIMPDHVHIVLHVKQTMTIGIKTVVRGWWQGVKKNYALSVDPNSIRDNNQSLSPIFTEVPFIRPMSRHGHLDAMMQYVKMNPQRLATKRLMPGYFRVQENIEIAGRKYSAIGNIALLQAERFAPVHVRRTMVEEAAHGDDKRLRDYMNGCVIAARQGTVMVSPFISEKEKEVQTVLLAEEHPIIILSDNGFRDYYKPSAGLFESVAAGRVLILSPWPYDPKKKRVSRAECVEMNKMAEEICTLSIDSELNSETTNIVKLPVTSSGEPDWQFMEDYIKSLPYSKNIAPSDPKEVVDELVEMKKEMIKMRRAMEAQQSGTINNYGTVNIYGK